MSYQQSHRRTVGSQRVEDKLPNYLLLFSCALQLACFGCTLYSFYALAQFFAQATIETFYRFGALQ